MACLENLAKRKLFFFQSPGSRVGLHQLLNNVAWWSCDHRLLSLTLRERGVQQLFPDPNGKLLLELLYFLHCSPKLCGLSPLFACVSPCFSQTFFSFSLACLYLFHRPIPPFTALRTFLLVGKTEWRKGREKGREKKLSAVVGICVSWTNRLHMLVVMVQDVAHLIYTAFIFLLPSALLPYLPAVTIFCPVLYWSHSFALWCSILCFSTTPDVTTG